MLLSQDSKVLGPADFRVLRANEPAIDEQGGVDSYRGGWTGELAAGSRFLIRGSRLAPASQTASGAPLCFDLGGVQVFVNKLAVALVSVSSTVIEAQLPWSMAGKPLSIQVLTTAGRSNAVKLRGLARNAVIVPDLSIAKDLAQSIRYSDSGENLGRVMPQTPRATRRIRGAAGFRVRSAGSHAG